LDQIAAQTAEIGAKHRDYANAAIFLLSGLKN
jgi:hypothetical protein